VALVGTIRAHGRLLGRMATELALGGTIRAGSPRLLAQLGTFFPTEINLGGTVRVGLVRLLYQARAMAVEVECDSGPRYMVLYLSDPAYDVDILSAPRYGVERGP